MSLNKTTFDIPVTNGINTNISVKNLTIPDLLTLRNGRYLKSGKIEKRFGNTNLGLRVNTGTLNTPKALDTIKNELLLLSADHLYTYSNAIKTWYDRGVITAATVDMTIASASPNSASAVDVGVQGNLKLVVWLENTTLYYSVFDLSTNAVLVDRNTLITSASSIYPRIVSVTGNFYIFYNDSTNLKCLRIPTANPANSSLSTVYSTLDSSGQFEVTSANDLIYIIFKLSGSSSMRISRLSPELVITSTNTISAAPTSYSTLAFHAYYETSVSDYRLAIGWVDSSNNVSAAYYNTSLNVIFGATTLETLANVVKLVIAPNISTTSLDYFYTVSAADTKNYYTKLTNISLAGSAGTPAVILRSVGLVSKPAIINDVTYLNVLHESTLQSTYFTILTSGHVVAKYAPGEAGTHSTTKRASNFIMGPSETEYIWGALKRGRIQSENATLFASQNPYFATFNTDTAKAYVSTKVDNILNIAGGTLAAYDGRSVTEYGFNIYPEDVTISQSGSGTPLPVGTYLVYTIYEWTDNRGNRMQSAPSVAKSITTNGTASQIDVVVPALRITDKSPDLPYAIRSSVKIRAFITQDSDTVPYYIAETDNPNILTTDSATISITSFTDLTSHEILYTSSGELENIAPPAHKYLLTHDNRLIALGLEDGNKFQFSKQLKTGIIAGFNESFSGRLDPTGGDIVAGASIDNNLIIFKKTATYVISGTGPNDLGQNSAYNPPQLISSDIGCNDPKSILVTPSGVIWKSNKGLYLLDRGLGLTPIGKPVKDYDSNTIISSDILRDSDEVRFVTDANVTLVYNYFFKQWSIYDTPGALDATTWMDSEYVYLTSTKVMLEDSTTYLDDGSYVPMVIRTGWIHFAGIQGYQRLYELGILGTYYTNHSFNIKFFYDYSDIVKYTRNITASEIINTSVYGDSATYGSDSEFGGSSFDEVYQIRIDNPHQLCQSLSIQITDTSIGETNNGQGFSLEGLACTIGRKNNIFRTRPARSF